MSGHSNIPSELMATAYQTIGPFGVQAAEELGVTDETGGRVIGLALGKAFAAGFRAGENSVLERAAEQGLQFDAETLRVSTGESG